MYTTHTNFSIKYSFPIGMIVILNQSAFEFSQLTLMQWFQEIFKKKNPFSFREWTSCIIQVSYIRSDIQKKWYIFYMVIFCDKNKRNVNK